MSPTGDWDFAWDMALVQCESLLLYCAVSAVFMGSALHKLIRNKVKIEHACVCGLLSLLIVALVCFYLLSRSIGLTIFILSCITYYISIPVRDLLPTKDKAVLITGCDSGLGHALAKHLDELGVLVFASVLDKKGQGAEELRRICSSRLSIIQLDVTDSEQIKAACSEIKGRLQGLWGIVHNAGVIGYIADGELLPISLYKQCMDVNFFGAAHVTKTFLPLLRKAKGRLICISSMAGHVPIPRLAAYAASKAALTMYCAVMRQDLIKWGVKVAAVHPSGFKTNIYDSHENLSSQNRNILDSLMPDVKEDYGEEYLETFKDLHHEMFATSSSDLTPVLEDVCHALLARNPHFSYTPGRFAHFIPCLFRNFPLWVYDHFAKKIFQIHRNILPRSLQLSQTKNWRS
ncbi:estradiol 17-beta-dehydrogenase 2 [Pelobates cultripes]|uniref:Estradiol 17-beta-dehydrogenase 2 n=1 Tax=Pelobates cultripes TaxID=61616 RepID=A0AAD1TFJ4_PELCU|nr:estradiol 17-beta-dehydrogenase 2 [Pelobates cultripes]